MIRNAADFKDLLYRLMPRGKGWPVDATATPVWDSLLGQLSQEWARIDVVLQQIPFDLIPTADMSSGLLDVWERILDLSAPSDASNASRVTAIRAVLLQEVGPNLNDLQTYADTFGNNAALEHQNYSQFQVGHSVVGDAVNGVLWLLVIGVAYDGPADSAFEAAMRAVAPANSILLFTVL